MPRAAPLLGGLGDRPPPGRDLSPRLIDPDGVLPKILHPPRLKTAPPNRLLMQVNPLRGVLWADHVERKRVIGK